MRPRVQHESSKKTHKDTNHATGHPHPHPPPLPSPARLSNRAGLTQLIGDAGRGRSVGPVRATIDQLLQVNVFINEAGSSLKRGRVAILHAQEGAASG